MGRKRVVVSSNHKASTVAEEEELRWAGLHPDLLSLIFLKLPLRERLTSVPLVCKPWMEAAMGPSCWLNIDIDPWCRRRNRSRREVDMVVNKLIRRTDYTVQRLSAYNIARTGFLSAIKSGRCLQLFEIPGSRSIKDHLVLKHLKPLPNLRVLDISHCSKIKAKGLTALGKQCKSLVHLIRNIPPPKEDLSPIDDSEAKSIADTMPHLQRLELCFGRFGNSGLSEILTKCKSLTHLDIRGCLNVKLNGVLQEMCKKLECFQTHCTDYFFGFDRDKLLCRYRIKNVDESELFKELEARGNQNYRYG